MPIRQLDAYLIDLPASPNLSGVKRVAAECFWFAIKEVRACLFAGLFFLAVFAVPRAGLFGIPRYDLLLIALVIQGWMVWTKLETWDELKAISLFHLIGFALEVFKTSSGIRSWSYPDFAYIDDYRWYLAACALGMYARTSVVFRPLAASHRSATRTGHVMPNEP